MKNRLNSIDLRPSDTPTEPIPAATVVLLRDTADGVEALMLRKNAKINFGGLWVFPGGRVDSEDQHEDGDELQTARTAAVREAQEEASLKLDAGDFVWMSHWTPPPIRARRFATWFFVARAPEQHDVSIDGGEIHDHRWLQPGDALTLAAAGEIEIAPPTWVTLHYLSHHENASSALAHFAAREPLKYQTHFVQVEGGQILMWRGDAGYDTSDPSLSGQRHRLTMIGESYEFEDSGAR